MQNRGYLNSQQKQALCLIFACSDFLGQASEKLEGRMPKEFLSDLKRGSSFTKRAWNGWLSQTDDKSAKAIVNIIKDMEIGVITKRSAKVSSKYTEQMIVGREYIERMSEDIMSNHCQKCDGGCRDTCPFVEGFVHFGIPEYDPNHPKCPYAWVSEVVG